MISIVSSVHKRDISLWLKTLANQTAKIEVVLVVYDDKIHIPNEVRQSDNGVGSSIPFPVKVIMVKKHAGAYPEAWLKNIGIRAAAHDVICCTNIDIIYTSDFFNVVEQCCSPRTLVQATRLDIPEGSVVRLEGENILVSTEGGELRMTCQPLTGMGIPLIGKASGDCQCMRREDWESLRGYNERMTGWGGLDTDLECRALLSGMNIYQMGFSDAIAHYHIDHPRNIEKNRAEGQANGKILQAFLASDLQPPNEVWGEYHQTRDTGVPVL